MDPTYYTSQGIIAGGSQAFTAIEGRSTPTGLESACTVSVRDQVNERQKYLVIQMHFQKYLLDIPNAFLEST